MHMKMQMKEFYEQNQMIWEDTGKWRDFIDLI